jgi:hypothetical protein
VRALSGVALCLTLWTAAPAEFPRAAQPPPAAPTFPEEDPVLEQLEDRRATLEHHLEMERRGRLRLTADEDLLASWQREIKLLGELIATKIALGEDQSANNQERERAHAEVKKLEEQITARMRMRARVEALQAEASQALYTGDFARAKRLIDEALTLDPQNGAVAALAQRITREYNDFWILRSIKWSALGASALAGLGLLWAWLKRRRYVGSLEMIEGPQPGETFRLEKERTVLGALPAETDWPIVDLSRKISRRHCEITKMGRRYFLTDLSTNGTEINGQRVAASEPVLLRRGDTIALSEDVVLRFR